MLTSNVPNLEKRAETTEQQSVMRRLLRVYRAARLLATSAESMGNRMFREAGTGDLLFLRQAVEEAEPWVNKEVRS